jgi:hypothetical protein
LERPDRATEFGFLTLGPGADELLHGLADAPGLIGGRQSGALAQKQYRRLIER